MLKLFGVSQDDTNYQAQIGQGLLANTDYFRVTRIEEVKENERGALWERV
jgi:hypothetical protein